MAFPSKGKDRPVGPKGAKPTKRPTKKNPVVKGTLPLGPPGLGGGLPAGAGGPPAPLGPPAAGVGPAGGVGPQAALLAKLMAGGGGGGGYGA